MAGRVGAVRVPRRPSGATEPDTAPLDAARGAVAAHPVHGCPDRPTHLAALARVQRRGARSSELTRRCKGRTESLARRFDRVLRLLEAWDYLDGWALTEQGRALGRLYHECDLLIAECAPRGAVRRPRPAALAGLASVFGYEHRSPDAAAGAVVPVAGGAAAVPAHRVARAASCTPTRRPPACRCTRPPDPTFLALAHAWAAGEGLEEVLEDEDVTAGDFVRVVRQVDRPAAPDRRRRAGRRRRRSGPAGGRGAAPRRVAVQRRPRQRDDDDAAVEVEARTVEKGAGGVRRAAVASCGRRPRGAASRSSRRAALERPGEPASRPSACSAATCAGPLGGRGDERAARRRRGRCRRRRRGGAARRPVRYFVAHVVVRGWSGAGPIVAAMNAQYLGRLDVAPRPIRATGCSTSSRSTRRCRHPERWKAWRRLPQARTCLTQRSTAASRPLQLDVAGRASSSTGEVSRRPDAVGAGLARGVARRRVSLRWKAGFPYRLKRRDIDHTDSARRSTNGAISGSVESWTSRR